MRYVEAGGVRVSAVGLGTWQFGSTEWGYGSGYANEVAPQLVRRALELGITLFDTAEVYAFGRSERILGEALAERRDRAFVATKLFPVLPFDPVVGARARGSARRLGVEVIDLYQVHWPNPVVPLARTMAAFEELLSSGLIRHAGVSNFSLAQWQEAESALGHPVLSNQVRFSLLDRGPMNELVPWASAHDRFVIAYSPLAQGLLSGRYGVDHRPGGLRSGSTGFLPENLERLAPVVDVLRAVADAHDASSAQVALAWLLRRPNVVVIPGASSVAQLESNAEAAELSLADDEDAALLAAAEAYHPLGALDAVKVRAERVVDRVRRAVEGLSG